MKVYMIQREDGYTRAVFEDKEDAIKYINWLEYANPEHTYTVHTEVLMPKGYGQYWSEQVNKNQQ